MLLKTIVWGRAQMIGDMGDCERYFRGWIKKKRTRDLKDMWCGILLEKQKNWYRIKSNGDESLITLLWWQMFLAMFIHFIVIIYFDVFSLSSCICWGVLNIKWDQRKFVLLSGTRFSVKYTYLPLGFKININSFFWKTTLIINNHFLVQRMFIL